MAKRGRRRRNKLDTVAAGIGSALGRLMNRMDSWRRQRDEIAAEVRQAVEAGQRVLQELGQDAGKKLAAGPGLLRRRKGGRRKGFKMSKAARAKISAAAKKRWAERKKQPSR